MKHEVKTVLEAPFTPEQIKTRKGNWGKNLEYLEGHTVIQRLNDAFDSDWSFEITEYQILEEEVIVLGKLTVGDIVKMQFGGNKITRDATTGKPLSISDDAKSATTDCLKKVSSLLGVGLHLYGEIAPQQKENSGNSESAPVSNGNGKPTNGNGNGNGNLITPKQKKYVLTLGRRTSLDSSQVNKLCLENYSAPLDELSKSDASDLIALLTA